MTKNNSEKCFNLQFFNNDKNKNQFAIRQSKNPWIKKTVSEVTAFFFYIETKSSEKNFSKKPQIIPRYFRPFLLKGVFTDWSTPSRIRKNSTPLDDYSEQPIWLISRRYKDDFLGPREVWLMWFAPFLWSSRSVCLNEILLEIAFIVSQLLLKSKKKITFQDLLMVI